MAQGPQEIIAELGPALRRVARTYAPAGADRDDLEQHILMAAWQALPNFRGESSVKTYLFRVAHNRAINWSVRARLEPVDTQVEDPRPDPERLAMDRQRVRLLEAAVRRLPLSLRQPLALALEGLSHAEIAEVIGISESNVAVRIHRARKAIKEALEERP